MTHMVVNRLGANYGVINVALQKWKITKYCIRYLLKHGWSVNQSGGDCSKHNEPYLHVNAFSSWTCSTSSIYQYPVNILSILNTDAYFIFSTISSALGITNLSAFILLFRALCFTQNLGGFLSLFLLIATKNVYRVWAGLMFLSASIAATSPRTIVSYVTCILRRSMKIDL